MCRLLIFSGRECEMAAGRVMKFQAVYQQKCQKVRKEAEAKKRKEENRAKRAAKEAKLAEKVMINRKMSDLIEIICLGKAKKGLGTRTAQKEARI